VHIDVMKNAAEAAGSEEGDGLFLERAQSIDWRHISDELSIGITANGTRLFTRPYPRFHFKLH
jgi:hypothetical protein